MNHDRIRVKPHYSENKGANRAWVKITLFVDDQEVGDVTVAGGPLKDVQELWDGQLSLPGLDAKWSK